MIQHPVPEPLLARIGDITVSFALLESESQSLVGELLGQEEWIGKALTAEVSFSQICHMAMSVCRFVRAPNDVEALEGLVKRAEQLQDERNAITHSLWGTGRQPGAVTRIKTTAKRKRGVKVDFIQVTAADLNAIAVDIMRLVEALQAFRILLRGQSSESE